MNRIGKQWVLLSAILSGPVYCGTFTFTADVTRCQLNSIVVGTCITSHADEPLAWKATLDCRVTEGRSTVQAKLDEFTNIADSTMYTVQLIHPDVLPQTWYCALNDGVYSSIFGTGFAGQAQSSDCTWSAGAITQKQ